MTNYLTVVIPVRNDAEGVRRCLSSLQVALKGRRDVRILVLDNGSEDASAETARAQGADVIECPGLSVAALRNRGAAESRSEWLGFVDADHELDSDWLDDVAAVMTRDDVGAVGAACWPPRPCTWVQRVYNALRSRPDSVEEVDWLGSGNLIVRRADFDRVGGFDESLSTCEDVDLCRRLAAAGRKLFQVPGMRSIHYGDPATLGALFRSEAWRGRDNLKVSFRHGLRLRDIPSVGFPILVLLATGLLVASVGQIFVGNIGLHWVAGGVLLLVFALRAGAVLRRTGDGSPRGIWDVARVAVVYELARAYGMIARMPHRKA